MSLFTPNVNIEIQDLQFTDLLLIIWKNPNRNYSVSHQIDKRNFLYDELGSSRSVYNCGKGYHFHSPMNSV